MTYDNPDDVQRRVERDRAEIDRTIDAIGHRLSPGQMLDQAMHYLRTEGGELGSSVGRSVKENPFPLLLTGVGLAWLMKSTASRDGHAHHEHESMSDYVARSNASEIARIEAEMRREPDETEEKYQSRLTEAKARVLSLKQNAGESADAFGQRVNDYLHRTRQAAAGLKHGTGSAMDRAGSAMGSGAESFATGMRGMGARTRDAQHRAREFYSSEPLIAAAVGVAAGALISALIPPTRAENRALGELGDKVRDKASDLASTAAERGKEAAAEGTRAAAHAARNSSDSGASDKAGEERPGR